MSGLAFTAFISSSIFFVPSVKGQSNSCDWFTGSYRDLGRGVIVHIGGGRVIVYNGNPNPLNGRCINDEQVEVNFGNKTMIGRKTRNAPDVAWTNVTVWRRESNSVTFPLSGF